MKLENRSIATMALLILTVCPAAELMAGVPFAELGQLDAVTPEPQRLPLSHRFSRDLVVFAGPASYNHPETTAVRLEVAATLFPTVMISLQTPLDDSTTNRPRREAASYLAIEPGAWVLGGHFGLGAGKLEVAWSDLASDSADLIWEKVELPPIFTEAPVVLAHLQTHRTQRFVTTRTRNVTRKDFEVALEVQAGSRPGRGSESVGWLAIWPDTEGLGDGRTVRAGKVSPIGGRPSEPPWLNVRFDSGAFEEPPRLLAALASYRDPRPAHLRYADLTARGFRVLIESAVTPLHQVEDVHYLAIEGSGILTADRARALEIVPAGPGSGIVTSEPPDIECGNDCFQLFAEDTVVTLTADAAEGSVFTGWSGDCEGTGDDVEVVMDRHRRCFATFELVRQLDVTVAGSGSGRVTSRPGDGIDCPGDCVAQYRDGTGLRLIANASADSIFTGWSGDCSGSSGVIGVVMDADRSCTATFELARELQITLEGSGSGTVASSPGDISCPGACVEEFPQGATVGLTAIPATDSPAEPGSVFTGWSGDCAGSLDAVTVAMDADLGCTATFDRVIGEVGRVIDLTHDSRPVPLLGSYVDPILIGQPPSHVGGDPCVVRLDDSPAGLSFRIQEPKPEFDDLHENKETVSFLVLERGSWQLADSRRVIAGTVDTSLTIGKNVENEDMEPVTFPANFFQTEPVVLTQVQTNNDTTWVKTRVDNVTNTGFDVALEEKHIATGQHGVETIGYVAFEQGPPGSWTTFPYEVRRFTLPLKTKCRRHELDPPNEPDEIWAPVNFDSSFPQTSEPHFIASMVTTLGLDNAYLRWQLLTSNSVQVCIEEDQGGLHTFEMVAYLALDGTGKLTGAHIP